MYPPQNFRPSHFERLMNRLERATRAFRNLGLIDTANFIYKSKISAPKKSFYLNSRYAAFPLKCRAGTSDIDVFRQIYVQREYRCLDELGDPVWIVDCGANVGFSAAYFLTRFPNAKLIAIEPDSGNFELLLENLEPYGLRAKAIQAAVWPTAKELIFTDFRDGREWSRSVREAPCGEKGHVPAVDIPSIIHLMENDRISLLKIDIEGAEANLFAENTEAWLGRIDNLVIELHDDACREIFHRAIAHYPLTINHCDELTVCTSTNGV